MGKRFDKFLLLMWKNWKLQYRRPLQTILEIAAPILFSILLVILRSLVEPIQKQPKVFYPFHSISSHFVLNRITRSSANVTQNNFLERHMLVYSPSPNTILDNAMNILKLTSFKNIKGYNNSKQLEHHFITDQAQYTLAGIEFDDELYNKSEIPQHIEVALRFPSELRNINIEIYDLPADQKNSTIFEDEIKKKSESVLDKINKLFRVKDWKTNLLYPIFESSGPRDPDFNNGALPSYYSEGFLALQEIITHILILAQLHIPLFGILLLSRQELFPIIHIQRFPFAAWKEDPLLPALIDFIGIIIMLSFVYTCINIVKTITNEKEKQLKEAMKIMGLPNWLHWTAWFTKTFFFLLISVFCTVALLTISWYPKISFQVFTYSNPLILFLFLVIYSCATITFCFSISVFFAKANTAAAVAGLLWFLSYAPYLFLQTQYDQLNLFTKLIVSLGFNTAMAYGFQIFLMYESTSEGIQWSNIWTPVSPDDKLTLGLIMSILAIDAVIYLFITIYVETVFPGEFGIPQPWYFPFTYSYWFGSPRKCYISENVINESSTKSDYFENNPTNLNLGIQIQNLLKVFNKKIAVNKLSLNIYENQITVLLGHNGAGKTTTMSMLTGIIPATSGTAVIQGFDIRTNMKEIRSSLGLCPQHNILFDDLTVKEHIYFFSKLKGLKEKQINEEIDKYVDLLDLRSKLNQKSKTLSGGMKRKLCVGIALCGDSKIVLLDEPTAGMDPSARRALWDLLQNQKIGRCILLTTHYMDEADLLGDRIAIMAHGELKCCGSSFFLKQKFGSEYHLILEKMPKCDTENITNLLRSYIPNLQIHRDVGSELVYLLEKSYSSIFEKMLDDLEKNSEKLGIRSYGMSSTPLEEVFIKVGSNIDSTEKIDIDVLKKNSRTRSNEISTQIKTSKSSLLTGYELIKNQILAMLLKKILTIYRTWLLQLIQILIPVVFLIIAIVVSRNINNNRNKNLPRLPLTLDSYKDPIILFQDDFQNNFSKSYYNTLKNYQVEIVSDVQLAMLNLSHRIPTVVKRQYIVGASFAINNKNIPILTAWFNNNPYHTPALAFALLLNSMYKSVLGNNYSISFVNHPLPFKADTTVDRLLKGNSMGFQLAFNIAFSMSFVSSFYILFYVKERVCKSKHLQFVSGVKSYIFWTTALVCDLLTFIVTILSILVTLLCFQEEGYKTSSDISRMFLLLFYFGFAMLPMIYIASYFFDIPASGYTRMTLFSVFTGVTAFTVIQILSSPGLFLKHIADTLHWGFLLIPHYSLATGIRDTYITFTTSKMCKFLVKSCLTVYPNITQEKCWELACRNNYSSSLSPYCCKREEHYYQWKSPGVGKNIVYSLTTGTVLFLFLILIEYKPFSKIMQRLIRNMYKNKTLPVPLTEDDDVLEEKQKIRNSSNYMLLKEHSLVLKNLTKYYKNFLAVNGIYLGVKQFECFGLLGVNGAGKTSTFKMITGDTNITFGNIWIHGYSIKTELSKVQKIIGYCPQFDALLTDLTAKETLIMFALLRGVPINECKYVAKKLAQDFDFYQHINKKIKHLSGGNKRKISTAIALTGDPPVICLDEPTAGMDPVTKRHLWNTLCNVRDSGKCLIFTSHSMEECEALCTRLAIMVNGNFKCIGSLQHLKNKFAAGYRLTVKIKKRDDGGNITQQDYENVENFIVENFPNATQQEKHQQLMTYYIAGDSVSLSKMFGFLEHAKTLNIEDYSLGQANLEQIFLTMTKYQR